MVGFLVDMKAKHADSSLFFLHVVGGVFATFSEARNGSEG